MKNLFREQWLNQAAQLILAEIMPFTLTNYRLSMSNGKIEAETANRNDSDDGTAEVFISAAINENIKILSLLTRNLIHAHLDNMSYGPDFQQYARAINLAPASGKSGRSYHLTACGPQLLAKISEISQLLGPIPHAPLNRAPKEKGRNNNKLKCTQSQCGFQANLSAKWAEQVRSDICPVCLNPTLEVIMA